MNKIVKINKDNLISYENDVIKYFQKSDITKIEESKNDVLRIIQNAKTKIVLTITKELDESILFELERKIILKLDIYLIIKSADLLKSNIQRYLNILVRVYNDLDNDFIIADNVGILFINPLNTTDNNPFIKLNENETKDLFYWFCYMFWEKSSIEIINGKPENIKQKVNVPFTNENDYINIVQQKEFLGDLYLPFDNNSKKLIKNFDNDIYLSKNLKKEAIQTAGLLKISSLILNGKKISDFLTEKWKLKENSLREITTEILPYNEEWIDKNLITINESKTTDLKNVTSDTIEKMGETKPNDFPKEKYIRNINYIWTVSPPYLPKEAKKSKLYDDWEKFNKKNKELIQNSKDKCTKIAEGKGLISKWFGFFTGRKRKAIELSEQITEYENFDFSVLYDYKDEYEKLKNFIIEIYNKEKEYEGEIEIQKKNDKIEELNNNIKEKKTEIDELNEEKDNINKEIKNSKKDIEINSNKISKIENNEKEPLNEKIKLTENELTKIKKEIDDANKTEQNPKPDNSKSKKGKNFNKQEIIKPESLPEMMMKKETIGKEISKINEEIQAMKTQETESKKDKLKEIKKKIEDLQIKLKGIDDAILQNKEVSHQEKLIEERQSYITEATKLTEEVNQIKTNKNINSNILNLENKIKNSESKLIEINTKIEDETERLEKIKKLHTEKEKKVDEIKNLKEQLEKINNETIKPIENEITDLNKKIKKSEQEIKEIEIKISKLDTDIKKNQDAIKQLEKGKDKNQGSELDYSTDDDKELKIPFPDFPKYQLPEKEIELYEANNKYYIEVEFYEQLQEANKLLLKVYKNGNVVAKKE